MTNEAARRDQSPPSLILHEHQRLGTSGARTALPFRSGGKLQLAVPQLAIDITGMPAHMNGGDSDIEAIIYTWIAGRFEETGRLPVPGGEDALLFTIGSREFLATASIRTGHGPYEMNAVSTIFEREGDTWIVFQEFETFAGRQWHHVSIDGRDFLALAQGVSAPSAQSRHPRQSRIFEWHGTRFIEFQVLPGCWGYNWASFRIGGDQFLGYADHTSPSLLYRWSGEQFEDFQQFGDHGGRAFQYFERDGSHFLAYAAIDGETTLHRWNDGRFEQHQRLGGYGGREFTLIETTAGLHLVRICFIEGTPAAPKTDLLSQIYRWESGRFETLLEFPTFGGTDAEPFEVDGKLFLAVSNSLTAAIRFRQDTIIYEISQA